MFKEYFEFWIIYKDCLRKKLDLNRFEMKIVLLDLSPLL